MQRPQTTPGRGLIEATRYTTTLKTKHIATLLTKNAHRKGAEELTKTIWAELWEEQQRITKEKEERAASVRAEVESNAANAASSKGKGKGKAAPKKSSNDPKPVPPTPPIPRMQCDEPRMFLHLATAIKLFMGRSINEDVIKKAHWHLEPYLRHFRRVSVLPNSRCCRFPNCNVRFTGGEQ